MSACEYSDRWEGCIERKRANPACVIREVAKHAVVLVCSVAFKSLLMRSEPASAQRDLGDRVEQGVGVACVTCK